MAHETIQKVVYESRSALTLYVDICLDRQWGRIGRQHDVAGQAKAAYYAMDGATGPPGNASDVVLLFFSMRRPCAGMHEPPESEIRQSIRVQRLPAPRTRYILIPVVEALHSSLREMALVDPRDSRYEQSNAVGLFLQRALVLAHLRIQKSRGGLALSAPGDLGRKKRSLA